MAECSDDCCSAAALLSYFGCVSQYWVAMDGLVSLVVVSLGPTDTCTHVYIKKLYCFLSRFGLAYMVIGT